MQALIVNASLLLVSILGGIASLPVMIGQIALRAVSKKYTLSYYMRQIAVANDVTAGSIIYGSRHTISAITGAKSLQGSRWHRRQEKVIDGLFYSGHCKNAAKGEGLI